MASNVLSLVVQVDNRGANRSIDGLNRSLSAIEVEALRAGRGASRGFQQVEQGAVRAAASVRTSFAGLGGVLGAIGGAKIFSDLSVGAVRLAADFETASSGIRVLVGDIRQADALIQQVKDLAATTPFGFAELTDTTKRLLGMRFVASEIPGILKAVSGAAAALGTGSVGVDRVTLALGQMRSAGRVMGGELRQLQEANIDAVGILAEGFGKSTAEMRKLVSDGVVPADAAIKILTDGLNQRFGPLLAQSMDQTNTKASNLRDTFEELGRTAGDMALEDVKAGIAGLDGALKGLNATLKENPTLLRDLASATATLGGIYIAYKLPAQVIALATALKGLSAVALLSNPFGLLAAGAGLVAIATYKQISALEELDQAQRKAFRADVIRQFVREGRANEESFRAMGFSVNEVADALGRVRAINKQAFDPKDMQGYIQDLGLVVKLNGQLVGKKVGDANLPKPPSLADPLGGNKLAEERLEVEKRARELVAAAQAEELGGLAKIAVELRKNLELKNLTNRARADFQVAAGIQVENELRRIASDRRKAQEAAAKDEVDAATEAAKLRADAFLELRQLAVQRRDEEVGFELEALRRSKDARVRELGAVDADTLEAKKAIEDQKLGIEIDYLNRSKELQLAKIRTETEFAVAAARRRLEGIPGAEVALQGQLDQIRQSGKARETALEATTADAIKAARTDAVVEIGRAEREQLRESMDAQRNAVESFRNSVDGVVNALISRDWRSVWQAVFLAPLKSMLTNGLTALFAGAPAAAAGGAGRGGLLGGFSGGSGLFGRLAGFGGVGSLGAFGAPGGTPGFAGPVGMVPAGAGGTGGAGGLRGVGGLLSGQAAGAKGFLSGLGNIGFGPKGGDFGGEVAGSYRGVGGVAGGALLAGGGTLAYMGLRRGGVSGLAMTTAGGALIGAKFGGPLGAAIGAAVGFAAGTVRLFIKGAEQKIVEKVKSVYGIDISRQFARDPLLPLIKQGFGGNIDVGLRSGQVRDLIELYAMSTGQSPGGGFAAQLRPVSLVQSGGSLRQEASYLNGSALPTILPSAAASTQVVVQSLVLRVDGQEAVALMDGRAASVVQSNPRLVQSAAAAAQRGSFDRRESLARLMAPNMITA